MYPLCEVKQCKYPSTHIYGPEREAETGKLMYLCALHAAAIRRWATVHADDPVDCPTHGRIGAVKNYMILKDLPPSMDPPDEPIRYLRR